MIDDIQDELEALEENLEGTPEKKSQLAEKSVEELISMNEEAQKQISRQGNEIGELRNLTNEILSKQLEETAPKQPETEPDWDYHPKEATEQLINDKVGAIEAKLEKDAQQRGLQSFESAHPDYKDVAQSDQFREWVTQSRIRARMYDEGNAGNFASADELFTEWERLNKEDKPEIDNVNAQALKDAKMEKGGGTPNTKKIFRRKEVINLRLRDPEAYEARIDEFRLAYKDGRVR